MQYHQLALVILGLCISGHEHGVVLAKYNCSLVNTNWNPVHHKYLGTRVSYYRNSSASLQLELLIAGDVNPNPGPESAPQFLTHPNRERITYSRTELLQANSVKQNVSLSTWPTITSLDIQSKRVTHRGIRGGVRKQRHQVQSSVLQSSDNHPHSPVSLNSSHPHDKDDHDNVYVALWNARSARNKTTTCYDYVLDNELDAMYLTETWLRSTDNVVIGEMCPPGFAFTSVPIESDSNINNNNDNNYCGVGVLYRCPLKFQIIPFEFKSVTFEYAIFSNTQRKVYYMLIYRPPPSTTNGLKTSQFLTDFEQFIIEINSLAGKVMIFGDFNLHMDNPSLSNVTQFTEIISSAGFYQYVHGPTHKHGHTLDLVLARPDDHLIKECTVGVRLSDHYIVCCTLLERKPTEKVMEDEKRNFHKIDKIKFQSDLKSEFVKIIDINDVDDLTMAFEKAIITILDMGKRHHSTIA